MIKLLAKIFAGLAIGIVAGLAIAAVTKVAFTDTTFPEFIDSLRGEKASEMVLAGLVAIGAFVLSLVILIPAHEAGHLVCGLLTGYKFVSFRIFNYTFIKTGGKVRVKKFSVAGTGGQCLLSPPDMPLEEMPTGWYNAGGVLANLILLLLALPLAFLDLNPYLKEAVFIFCLTDGFLLLTNGIPMKLGGISNDAYNMLHLRHNVRSKRALALQLRTNAHIQEGVRPKDMPAEWFIEEEEIDYRNPLEVGIPMMRASRLIDEMKWEEAFREFGKLYSHKEEIMPLYANEIACELAFCAMATGRLDQARTLLDSKLMRYIESYKKVMTSKLRILCAKALYLDGNRAEAERIRRALEADKDNYLLQGEAASDLAIMNRMLSDF